MRKKLGFILIGLGAALILSALFLLMYNQQENKQAGEVVQEVLPQIQTVIKEQPVTIPTVSEEISAEVEQCPSKIVMVNGYNYIGILNLPTLLLELPVLSNCDEDLLKIAPCRDYGDLSTDDLVIAAHNYKNHFGRLSQLKNGDEVTFIDMSGNIHRYEVSQSMMISPNDVDLVVDSGYELVLYTCDYTNQNRIAVYCRKI